MSRRRWMVLATTAGLAGCTSTGNSGAPSPVPGGARTSASAQGSPSARTTTAGPAAARTLVIYFSRAGENFDRDGEQTSGNGRPISVLEVGNTEIVAGVITELLGCEVFRIEPVDPYPFDYAETVEQNAAEQQAQTRPAIVDPLTDLSRWDTVLIGSPVWGGQAPRIMLTLLESLDFAGKTVAVFTTHAGSGLAGVPEDYRSACQGSPVLTEELALRGEECAESRPRVAAWLRTIGLLAG